MLTLGCTLMPKKLEIKNPITKRTQNGPNGNDYEKGDDNLDICIPLMVEIGNIKLQKQDR